MQKKSNKKALITGITGQDGYYLAKFLLNKNYEITGLTRDKKVAREKPSFNINKNINLIKWNPLDKVELRKIIRHVNPNEIYNFAGFSEGIKMFQNPDMIAQINGVLVTNFLEIIRDINDKIKFVQASSREIFGESTLTPQTEKTPKNPRNPYGAAKLYADNMVKIYRSNYKLFAASAILYNHESPLRTMSYVSKKICLSAAQIKLGLKKTFELGDIENLRDWGFAGDYVEAMWMMLQQKNPDDYIIASGQLHSVKDMCKIAFDYLGLNYKEHIIFNKNFYRPKENFPAVGNIDKAKKNLGWKAKMNFSQLIHYMIDFEIEHIKKGTNS